MKRERGFILAGLTVVKDLVSFQGGNVSLLLPYFRTPNG